MELPQDISSCHELIKLLLGRVSSLEELVRDQQEMLASQSKLIEEQQAIILSQSKRIEALESRLNKNSKNSHKPPSSDGLKKAPAFPRGKGQKRGGQSGHTGKSLKMVADPDVREVLSLSGCCGCGAELAQLATEEQEVRQVFDIETRLRVTEYVQLSGQCSCGQVHKSPFPFGVNSSVQYGPGVRALTTLLTQDCAVSVDKTKQLFSDLFGYQINEATILNNTARCYEHLADSETRIKEALLNAQVSHYDESGVRVAGKLHWLHVACSMFYSFFLVHPRRGREALDQADIITQVSNWIVHDCWGSYFAYQKDKRAICGAHLIRELRALTQKGSPWAGKFADLLLDLYELSDKGTDQLQQQDQLPASQIYDQICQYADSREPLAYKTDNRRGRTKQTEGRNLLNRLIEHKAAVLAFAFHQEVPFTNNLAERALRPVKTKQKVAGAWRTTKGANHYARIRGFIDTARKQQRNVFDELKRVFNGASFITHPVEG